MDSGSSRGGMPPFFSSSPFFFFFFSPSLLFLPRRPQRTAVRVRVYKGMRDSDFLFPSPLFLLFPCPGRCRQPMEMMRFVASEMEPSFFFFFLSPVRAPSASGVMTDGRAEGDVDVVEDKSIGRSSLLSSFLFPSSHLSHARREDKEC